MRDDARRYARRVMLSSSDVFLRGRGSQLGMLQWALAQKQGEKAPRRSRSAVDEYECNLLLFCRGRDEVVLLFLGSLKSRAERLAGLATQEQERAAAGNKTAAQRS